MSGIESLAAIAPSGIDASARTFGAGAAMPAQPSQASFADLLSGGLRQIDAQVSTANDMVRRFALDDSVPLHQVTFALEQARLSVELAMQVQTRVIESYRQLMNMQL